MNRSGAPELTPEIEKMAKEELLRQFEDQYDVKVIVIRDNTGKEPDE